MHHVMVYRGSVGIAGVDVALTAVNGGDTVQGGMYYPPDPLKIIWAASFGTDIYDPWFTTPLMREMGPNYVRTPNVVTPLGSNPAFDERSDNPIDVGKNDPIDVRASNANAGAQTGTVILGLQRANDRISSGRKTRRIKVTGGTTLTANVWTPVGLTFANGLPPGRYAIVGGQFYGVSLYAWRLIVPGQYYKPGSIGQQTVGQKNPDNMRQRDWGVWGYFDQSSLPAVECLATAGDTVQTGYLDIAQM